jgi:membrane-associated phospholipid phosphatase
MLRLGIAALAVVFVVLAMLVAAGHLHWLDRYAVEHWMPGLEPGDADETVPPFTGIFMPFGLDSEWWQKVLDVVMYPASALVSFTVFAVGSLVLWRRGAKVAAVAWGATWFVANAIEVAVKVGIEKPGLYLTEGGVRHQLDAFDHAFPSGHAMRSVMVAAIVVYVWSRLGWIAGVWVAVSAVCLVVSSWHVPSDVVGGLVFGGLVVLVTLATIATLNARR